MVPETFEQAADAAADAGRDERGAYNRFARQATEQTYGTLAYERAYADWQAAKVTATAARLHAAQCYDRLVQQVGNYTSPPERLARRRRWNSEGLTEAWAEFQADTAR